jgi:hypothetical protein
MLIKAIITLFLYSLSFTGSAFAKNKNCYSSEFFYLENKVDKKIKTVVCFEDNFYTSESCYKSQCSHKKLFSNLKVKITQMGSPHFTACHKVGGIPILGRLQFQNKKIRTSLCFDKRKQDFVDSNYILSKIIF